MLGDSWRSPCFRVQRRRQRVISKFWARRHAPVIPMNHDARDRPLRLYHLVVVIGSYRSSSAQHNRVLLLYTPLFCPVVFG